MTVIACSSCVMRNTGEVVSWCRRSEAEGMVRDFEQGGLRQKTFCKAQCRSSYVGLLSPWGTYPQNDSPVAELLPVELMGAKPVGGCLHAKLLQRKGGRG